MACKKVVKVTSGPCVICEKPESEKPMTFRGTRWCSEDCRKIDCGEN